ncbi:MAG: tetratricopeptide repeat protein [Candidatus Sulfotelmatobacter sp.]
MAFGFGFNKQKVLSAAEKYIQQGKTQNAIAEYEKILKADAKDLTVTNTVGDLYSRLGDVDKATECFKSVGDAYAQQGFTVKAIAMYKKISKLKPSLESVLKLAELYTQQGLFNDARAQYLQVAEEFLKSGELENAVRIFQKILEMDPENTAMRLKLAEVYVRLGKKTEAWQIFSAVAEALRSKGSLPQAEEVLQRMLKLDPGNSYALLMQARNLLEAGDAEAAIDALQKVPDLDSNPEGLRDLLNAYLKTGRLSDAGTLATKLQAVHNDLSAISTLADALMQAGQFENALQIYDQHADRLLAENSDKVLKSLHSIIGHVRDNPASLEKLLDLFQKAGENTHITEVIELLAHASVQSGDMIRARDLYQKLTSMEPGNPLHMTNYQQVVSQLSGASGARLISAEEAAVIVDELETTCPAIHQHYSDAAALAVRSALTDAELFISYNMPAKALGPLLAALPQAPSDLRLNQRLAALHTRASRFAEAAVCCRTLQSVYSEAGYPDEASRYGDLARRYEERSAVPMANTLGHVQAAAATEEFAVSTEAVSWPATSQPVAEEAEFAVVADQAVVDADQSATLVAGSETAPAEIDLSSEWDDTITIETDDSVPAEAKVDDAVGDHELPVEAAGAGKHDLAAEACKETVEEIRFYLEHGMPQQAQTAFEKLQSHTSDESILAPLEREIKAASQTASTADEIETVETIADSAVAEPSVVEAAAVESGSAEPAEFTVEEPAVGVPEFPAVVEPVVSEPAPVAQMQVAPEVHSEPPDVKAAPREPAKPQPAVLQEFVSDLESSLGENFLGGPVVQQPAPARPSKPKQQKPELEPIGNAAPTRFGTAEPEVLGTFVADLEESLGDDFLKGAPVAEPESAPATQAPVAKPAATAPAQAPATAAATASVPAVASAAAAASGVAASGVATIPQSAKPQASKPAPPAAKASPFSDEASIDLGEMFGELKHDLEVGATATDEDPETHYNLGIAFREMGLLDEAIGELQKTCQAVDRGHPFPQVMQTYTWLAQCFLDKGVPQAAIRWYDKALAAPGVDEETRTALHYELAAAYETAGDRPSALKHFMEVYGRNIDYRDVAERIKPLKS